MPTPNIATIVLEGVEFKLLLPEKKFRTGSHGYYGQDKMTVDDKRYQVMVTCVEIGSKGVKK